MVYMASSVLVYRLSPYRGWPEAAAWVFLVLALPLLVRLLGERRHKAVVCYSWFWGSLRTSPYLLDGVQPFMADDVFALAAALTLDGGQYAFFLGRGGGSTSPLWRRGCVRCSAGGLLEFRVERRFRKLDLMGFVFVILAIDAVLLTRMGIKRNRLAAFGGLTPFVMLVAASLAVLKQPVCLLPSLYLFLPRFLPWQLSGGGTGAIPTC